MPEGSRVYRGARLDSNLSLEGALLRIVPDRVADPVNRQRAARFYRDIYRFRGIADTTLHMNEATRRIADNYASGLLHVADAYRRSGQVDSALALTVLASRLRPRMEQPRLYLAQLAGEHDRPGFLDSLAATVEPGLRADLYYNYGLTAEFSGRRADALRAYTEALVWRADRIDPFRRAAALLFEQEAYDSLVALIDRRLRVDPGDSVVVQMRREAAALRDRSRDTARAADS